MSEAEYMARLIDAGELNFHCNYNGDCSGDISHCKECDNYVLDYRDIQEQPTAYDVDEVVKSLKKLRDCKYLTGITNNAYEFGACDALNDAIKIIKAGATNES